MEFLTATTLDEALGVLAEHGPGARVVAGGTDVMIQLQRGEITVPRLLSIDRVPGLAAISLNGVAQIGALATHRAIATDPALKAAHPSLAEAALTVGGWQTQAVGTIGGNLCNASPAADLAAPLLVNDARLTLRSRGAGERQLAYEEFVTGRRATALGAGELLTGITLAPVAPRSGEVYLKVGRRSAMEVAIVGLAVRLAFASDGHVTHARVALASVGPVPLRAVAAEAVLVGSPLTEPAVANAAAAVLDAIDPIDDLRGSASYRRMVIPGLLRRAAAICAGRAGAPSDLKELSWS